jgi:hypothetical protein
MNEDNQYRETDDRSGFDSGLRPTTESSGPFGTRRQPIIVTGETVTSEVVQTETDSGLSTADIAGKNQPRAGSGSTTATGGAAVGTAAATEPAHNDEHSGPLFSPDAAKEFRSRWDAIQVGFVDEPRHAVEQADNLLASTIKRLAEIFAEEREKLEDQWGRGESVSTEDLRLALRRYRSFFGRLLSV